MAILIGNGYQVFTDTDGEPLESGYIFIGEEGANPLTNPLSVYWDSALTIRATNIRTKGGYPSYNGSPGNLYTPESYSIVVQDRQGRTVYTNLNADNSASVGPGISTNSVDTIADLRAFIPYSDDYKVLVVGYYTVGDGNGGPLRYWAPASVATDNGGSVIRPTSIAIADPGRWLFSPDNGVQVTWFGAVGDGVADDSVFIQTAIDSAAKEIFFPPGTYKIATALVMAEGKSLKGVVGGYGISMLSLNTGVNGVVVSDGATTFDTAYIEGLTFHANAGTTSIGVLGDVDSGDGESQYTKYLTLKNNWFSAALSEGVKGDFLQMLSVHNNFGEFGTPQNMVKGYNIIGDETAPDQRPANVNQFINDAFVNINGAGGTGIYAEGAWGINMVGCVFDVIASYATHFKSCQSMSFVQCWAERCSSTSGMFKFESGTNGIFAVNFTGCLIQVLNATNLRVLDEAGSIKVTFEACTFTGLLGGAINIANNITKINVSSGSYYPSGFADVPYPMVVKNDAALYQAFKETDNAAGDANYYVKVIKHDSATFTGSILGLHSKKAASGTFGYLRCRADIDGAPATQHYLDGTGRATHSGNVEVGSAGTGGFDAGHLLIGTHHLWVDSTGDLRIHTTAPAGDFSGVVVGTQT